MRAADHSHLKTRDGQHEFNGHEQIICKCYLFSLNLPPVLSFILLSNLFHQLNVVFAALGLTVQELWQETDGAKFLSAGLLENLRRGELVNLGRWQILGRLVQTESNNITGRTTTIVVLSYTILEVLYCGETLNLQRRPG